MNGFQWLLIWSARMLLLTASVALILALVKPGRHFLTSLHIDAAMVVLSAVFLAAFITFAGLAALGILGALGG